MFELTSDFYLIDKSRSMVYVECIEFFDGLLSPQ